MKSKLSWIPFIPLALAACFFKLAQVFLPEGTVFGMSAFWMEYCYLGAVGLIFIFAFLFCVADKKISSYYLLRTNVPACILGMIIAPVMAAEGAYTLMNVFNSGNINALQIIGAIMSLLSAVVFVVFGLNHTSKNRESKRFALLNVLPALYFGVRMILSFVDYTTISIRLADVSKLICYIFATLFFFRYAVMLSLTKTKNAVKFCFVYGLPAVAVMIPYGVYHLLTTSGLFAAAGETVEAGAVSGFSFVLDNGQIMNYLQPIEILLLGLYILSVLIELTLCVRDKDSVKVIVDEGPMPDISEEKVDGFIASNESEDENDQNIDDSYLESRDTDDFLYQEVALDNDNPDVNEETKNDVENYLTEYAEIDSSNDENDDRPKDYEERLDDIDKLILEITEKID